MTILTYLQSKTWNFFTIIEVKNACENYEDELAQLIETGQIQIRPGCNGELIELIK